MKKIISKIKNALVFCKQVFRLFTFLLSHLAYRDKKRWIYGSPQGGFFDNSKYMFIYASEHYHGINHIWVSSSIDLVNNLKKLGYKAVYKFSPKGFYYLLTAKVYVFSYSLFDIHSGLHGGAISLNLWHGVPFKKIEYDIMTGATRSLYNPRTVSERINKFIKHPKFATKSTFVITTSEQLKRIFSSAFKLPMDRIILSSYPRNIIFGLKKEEQDSFIRKHETDVFVKQYEQLKEYSRVVIYMPTWRDSNKKFINEAISDFDELNRICAKHNMLFLIKVHPNTVFDKDISSLSHVKLVPPFIKDIYPILPYTDALISDYSSIVFDYALTNKKIILYPYDFDTYFSKDRESYFSYEEVFSKDYIKNFSQLLIEIDSLVASPTIIENKKLRDYVSCNKNQNDIIESVLNFMK